MALFLSYEMGRVSNMCLATRSTDISKLSDDELKSEICGLESAEAEIRLYRLALVAEIDRRCAYIDDGARSTVSWLIGNFGMSPRNAKSITDLASKKSEMPEITDAVLVGALSW